MNEIRTFTEQEYAKAAARIDALMPWDLAWGSTVVILIVRGDSLHVLGSGTLLRIGDESLLVTATHVIEDAGAQNLCIIRADQTRKDDIIPLEGEAILGDRDRLVVAVLRLNPTVIDNLVNRDFLRLDRVCRDKEDLSEAMFAAIGFPEILSGIDKGILKFVKYHHIAPAPESLGFGLKKFDRGMHFLVDADLSETRTSDGKPMEFRGLSGRDAEFPAELGGISGGSVWKLADNPQDVGKRGPGSARIVGVLTGVYEMTTFMVATRWSAVVGMLRDAIPDLRGPIDLWRGD